MTVTRSGRPFQALELKANHVQDELDTIQEIRKYLAPRHAPSQRTIHIGGSGTWTNLIFSTGWFGQVYMYFSIFVTAFALPKSAVTLL